MEIKWVIVYKNKSFARHSLNQKMNIQGNHFQDNMYEHMNENWLVKKRKDKSNKEKIA